MQFGGVRPLRRRRAPRFVIGLAFCAVALQAAGAGSPFAIGTDDVGYRDHA